MSKRTALSVPTVGLALALLAAPAAAQREWDQRWYNPNADPSDFILPMPCGGSMAFQQVRTPASEDLLEDYPVTLGQAEGVDALSEFIRQSYLLGSLTQEVLLTNQRVAYFYLGRYEVTIDQYNAVMEDECPDPGFPGLYPITDVSWFDAVEFTQRYTEWLLQNAPNNLPQEGQYRAYVRLPTEEEWEYAARGGAEVDVSTGSRQRLFPMTGPLSDYVWYQGSSNNEINFIGLLDDNPLLLHDILGNVEEMVLEPFRVNRVGRPHGQVGGFVGRGGSYITSSEALSTAARTEYSYFDERSGEALRLPFLGFRVALSAPVLASHQRIDRMREDWRDAQEFVTEDRDGIDPLNALETLLTETTDLEDQATLEQIRARFSEELAARSEIESRAVRSAIMSGATLIRMLRNDHRVIDAVERAYEFQVGRDPEADRTRRLREQLDGHRERAEITYRAYLNILAQAANDYSGELHRQQLALQQQSFEDVGLTTLIAPAELFTAQVLEYQDERELDRDALLEQILR